MSLSLTDLLSPLCLHCLLFEASIYREETVPPLEGGSPTNVGSLYHQDPVHINPVYYLSIDAINNRIITCLFSAFMAVLVYKTTS